MEIETAVRRMLLSVPAVTGYTQQKIFKFRLEEPIEGTSARSIVVSRNNGWAMPDEVKTSEFPILRLQLFSDPDRGAAGEILRLNAEEKAWALYRVVDPLFHGKRDVWWGAGGSSEGLRVVTSRRWREPVLVTQHDLHGRPSADPLGDSVYVEAEYALQVIH